MALIKKCYNCIHASKGFKISGKTHHQCLHPKHDKGFESGELTAWDTLVDFWHTCDDFEPKKVNINKKLQDLLFKVYEKGAKHEDCNLSIYIKKIKQIINQ